MVANFLQLSVISLLLGGLSIANAEKLKLAESGTALAKIVVSNEATVADKNAAEQLRRYLSTVTGAEFQIVKEENASLEEVQIVVGQGSRAKELIPDLDFASMKTDEVVIERVGNSLVLTGDSPRGALYATYQFLEDFVGCRWWTSTESNIPQRILLEVDELKVRYAPPFWYRQGPVSGPEEFVTLSKDNANRQDQTPEWGGRYEILGWVHTFSELLPPEEYFKDHPEWYTDPENNYLPCTAESKMPEAQSIELCTTNPAVIEELTRKALALIETNPKAGYISISQNDNTDSFCRCAECTAVVEKEGSAAGLIIQFVNRVAEKVEEKYPGFLVETLAYHFSEKPPKTLIPRKNVVVRMAPIARDFGHAISAEGNTALRNNLEAWQAAGAQLFIWDYVTNFHHVMMPHPNLLLIGDTLRFYKERNVKAMFLQGNVYSNGVGDFAGLRTWLISHLMWNPDADDRALINEYFAGYFGEAAPYLRQYIDLIAEAYSQQNKVLTTFNIDFSFLTLPVMNRATELFNEAAVAVKDNPTLSTRLARERMSIDLAWLWQYRDYKQLAKATSQPFLGPKDPHIALEEFKKAGEAFGIPRYRETIDFSSLITLLSGTLSAEFDEPVPFSKGPKIKNSKLALDIQENGFFQDSAALLSSIVEDTNASNGKAGEISPGQRLEAYLTMLGQTIKTGKWRIYAVARESDSAQKPQDAQELTLGIHDRRTFKDVVVKPVALPVKGKGYRLVDYGEFEVHSECILWLESKKENTSQLLIDRIVLVPQK